MRKLFIAIITLLVCVLSADQSIAQKKIVVMGSSTAVGNGASSTANSWAGKLQTYYRRNITDGADTIIYNIAHGSYTTYHEMPTNYPTPAGRPEEDENCNVTKALSYFPDIVIINLPTNDIASGFSAKEQMDNLRLMYSLVSASGAGCFITTSQPRHLDNAQRTALKELVDSVNNNFGFHSIDFWTDLVTTDGTIDIAPAVSAGDGIHINDVGHNFVYQRVVAKQLFALNIPLPLKLTDFGAKELNNKIVATWHTTEEEPNTFFEIQKSSDGQNFITKEKQNGKGVFSGASYSWTDNAPLPGKNIYRLKITEGGRVTYSAATTVSFKKKDLAINAIYLNRSSGSLTAEIYNQKSQPAVISIISATGSVVKKQTKQLEAPSCKITVAVGDLAAGQYFLSIRMQDGNYVTKSFTKQ